MKQTKRWCNECKHTVFSRGHEHGQQIVPPVNIQGEVRRSELAKAARRRTAWTNYKIITYPTTNGS